MATGRGIAFRSVRRTDIRREYEPLRQPGEYSPTGILKGHESLRQPGKNSVAVNQKGFEPLLKQGESCVKVSQSLKHCSFDLAGDHSLDLISKQLYELDGKDSEKLSQLVTAIKFACGTEEQLQNLANIIYRYSLEGKLNAHIGALICHHLENFKINNTKFRNVLLKLLQSDYEDRKLAYTQLDKFIMNIIFLCEIEHHMRLADGNRYALFDEPIINYFIMLVDGGSEKEVEAFVEQVRKCGKELQASKPEFFENLLVKIRKKVVSESSLSSSLRALLLETLEKILIEWKPITSSAQKFYDLMSKPIITFCD